jgi:SAM-dependent methyltransferase
VDLSVPAPQHVISAACEEDLARYGDSFCGVGYTKSPDEARERYAIMLEVIREPTASPALLDLGCGLGHLLDFIRRTARYEGLRYTGLDISRKYLDAARMRHPEGDWVLMDILEDDSRLPSYDYVVLNGLFNYRGAISREIMVDYWTRLTAAAFRHCRQGLAFNVMSTLVDWERDDLFHLPFDTMARIVRTNLSRHFVIRHDYDAYEYTVYVYRHAYQFRGTSGPV